MRCSTNSGQHVHRIRYQLDQSGTPVTFINMILYKFLSRLLFPCLLMVSTWAYATGDKEYGEYLSSECVTCHQAKASDAKIPVLHGFDETGFIALMKAYRAKELDNPTMRTIANRLTDEDIAALAAYYSSLPSPE